MSEPNSSSSEATISPVSPQRVGLVPPKRYFAAPKRYFTDEERRILLRAYAPQLAALVVVVALDEANIITQPALPE